MRIFHLTAKPPYPIIDGGCFASARLMEDLSQLDYELIHVTLHTKKHPFNKAAYPEKYNNIYAFHTDTSISISGALSSMLKGSSYNIERFRNDQFQEFLLEEVRDDDIIVIDGLYATVFLNNKWIKETKIILRSHNVEYKIWEDLSQNNSSANSFGIKSKKKKGNWLKERYLKYLSGKLKDYESAIVKHVDQIWTLSDDDLTVLDKLGAKFAITIPVSIPSDQQEHDYSYNSVYHLGSVNWIPNQESITILIDIWKNDLAHEGPELHLIGNGIQQQHVKNIIVHGFVDDLDKEINKQGILVAPIISGSGIRIKILEALARGIPVITTKKGAQGIESDDSLILAADRNEFVKEIKRLSENEQLRKSIGEAGRSHIRSKHDPEYVKTIITTSLERLKTN